MVVGLARAPFTWAQYPTHPQSKYPSPPGCSSVEWTTPAQLSSCKWPSSALLHSHPGRGLPCGPSVPCCTAPRPHQPAHHLQLAGRPRPKIHCAPFRLRRERPHQNGHNCGTTQKSGCHRYHPLQNRYPPSKDIPPLPSIGAEVKPFTFLIHNISKETRQVLLDQHI